MDKDGGPAFPTPITQDNAGGVRFAHHYGLGGMSLRDYFAAHAPEMPEQWFKDSPRKKTDPLWHWGEATAAWRYFYADSMLKAREAAP